MIAAANEAGPTPRPAERPARAIQKRLESLQKHRDREPEKRWQAHYDLMLAQIVAYQVKSYEYRACLEEMVKTKPVPKEKPTPDMTVNWVLAPLARPQGPQGRDREEVRRGDPAPQGGHRPPPQDPLGRPRPGRARPRLRRPAQRVAPQPEVQRAGQAGAEVLSRRAGRDSVSVTGLPTGDRGTRSSRPKSVRGSSSRRPSSTTRRCRRPGRAPTGTRRSGKILLGRARGPSGGGISTGVSSPGQTVGLTCSFRPCATSYA